MWTALCCFGASGTRLGKLLGQLLYDDLFAFAQRKGIVTETCEFDIDSPNEASRRFSFPIWVWEVGRQWVADGNSWPRFRRSRSFWVEADDPK
jgi:predicted GNAT superfamily acetyltransferase